MENGTSYNREIIEEYHNLSKENESQKISFYKKNEAFFDQIPLNKKIDIVLDFLNALFHRGEYIEYLNRCDDIIEALFDSRLFPNFEKENLVDLLYMKAASQFYNHDRLKCEETMRGLVALDKTNHLRQKDLLFRLFKSKRQLYKYQARGLVIAFILTSAILSIWTVLFVHPFKPLLVGIYQNWTIGMFAIGILVWLGFKGYNNFKSLQEVNRFINENRSSSHFEQSISSDDS